MQINIIDSIMGSGKTQFAIQHMNENKDENFIYITPYLDEVQRIKNSCNRHFIEPKECKKDKIYSKSKSLKELMVLGSDIATTHSLFKLVDEEAEKIIEASSYTLILDEVMDVVQHVPVNKADLDLLFVRSDTLRKEPDGLITLGDDAERYMSFGRGKFSELINMAKLKRLFMIDDTVLLWEFPIDIFRYFKEVYILTYLFDGQIQKYFFDFYDVKYDKYTVKKTDKYELIGYNENSDLEKRKDIGKLINIYEGKLNEIGRYNTALSYNWFRNESETMIEILSNNMYNYFRNIYDVRVNDVLWTCYKESGVKVKNYKRAFIAHNLRATNDYSHTHTLAYAVNRFINPYLVKYFSKKNVKVDEDMYALSEMIQWIFRSRVRNDESINIYIPSSRMRKLLIEFLTL